MVSSGRQAIACILLLLGVAIYSNAQTTSAKEPTASVSGKVTFKGKGVPGIMITVSDPYRSYVRQSYRGVTDASGNYRISNVPEGTYRVSPHALAYVVENRELTNPVNIADGDTIEDMNFVLVRGGVITGKVTDADGQALIEQPIILQSIGDQDPMSIAYRQFYTDDRGIYRAFGLRQGKYKVAAGHSGDQRLPVPGRAAQSYKQTFYPSTADEAKATVIEVSEGSEIKDIDVVIAGDRDPGGFKVSGRIVNGETGKPLPNIVYGITQHYEGGGNSTSGSRTNAHGEFKFENVLPGKYSVFVQPDSNSDIRGNSVRFEVTDHDISDLVLKTVKGASISGVVVLESSDEKTASKKLRELHVYAMIENDDSGQGATAVPLKPDGSFQLNGLHAGNAQIEVSSMTSHGSRDLSIVRIERDGIEQSGKINVKEGEQVQGIRLIVKHLTSAIRGQVKIEGELPSSARMYVSITFLDGNANSSHRSEELDLRRRFLAQGLAAGRYEVKANVYIPGRRLDFEGSKQEVTVTDNSVIEVVLTLKLKTNQDDDDDP